MISARSVLTHLARGLVSVAILALLAGCGSDNEIALVPSRTPDVVLMKTSMGSIEIRLFPDKAPVTVANFLRRDFEYAVFGEVIEGMDVVDEIRAVRTGAVGPFATDCPLETVEVLSISRVE